MLWCTAMCRYKTQDILEARDDALFAVRPAARRLRFGFEAEFGVKFVVILNGQTTSNAKNKYDSTSRSILKYEKKSVVQTYIEQDMNTMI